MDNEVYRQLSHHTAADFIAAELRRLNWRAEREFRLPDGRIADVLCETEDHDFAIIEIKSEPRASYLDDAHEKYGRWCNLLWVAFTEILGTEVAALQLPGAWTSRRDQVGIIGVYHEGIVGYRSPHMRSMLGNSYDEVRQLLALR